MTIKMSVTHLIVYSNGLEVIINFDNNLCVCRI